MSKPTSPTADDYHRILKTFSKIRYAHSSYTYLPKGCDARAFLMNDPRFTLSLTFVNFAGEFTGLFRSHDVAILWDDDLVKGTRVAVKAKSFSKVNDIVSRVTVEAGIFDAPPAEEPTCGCPDCSSSEE